MRSPRGKRKSISIPQTTFDRVGNEIKRRVAQKALKNLAITEEEQKKMFNYRQSKRFMQKVAGRAMELMGIKDRELKAKLHLLANAGIMEPKAEHKKSRQEITKLIGEERTKEFFDLIMKIGDANIDKLKNY